MTVMDRLERLDIVRPAGTLVTGLRTGRAEPLSKTTDPAVPDGDSPHIVRVFGYIGRACGRSRTDSSSAGQRSTRVAVINARATASSRHRSSGNHDHFTVQGAAGPIVQPAILSGPAAGVRSIFLQLLRPDARVLRRRAELEGTTGRSGRNALPATEQAPGTSGGLSQLDIVRVGTASTCAAQRGARTRGRNARGATAS
jgi:hypothetical protein